MVLPLPFVLGVRRLLAGDDVETDAHGNPVKTYADPTPWPVHGFSPGSNAEPGGDGNRDLSVIEWTVYAPASDKAPGEHDLVVLLGVEYAVEGRPADWTNGPWPHPTAGLSVELRRAEG